MKYRPMSTADTVPGTAMDALGSMMDIINARPAGFDSLEEAIQWQ